MRYSVLALAVFVGLLIAPPPSPVHLSYASSGSMAPTIGPGDGYFLVSVGDVSTGDVVTFYSEEREEYVTHRVVGETDEGYVTKGDANDETDQMNGLAPVEDEQILGEVLTIDGMILVIPGLGVVVGWLQSNPLVAALAGGLASVALLVERNGNGHDRVVERNAPTASDLVRPVLVVVAVGCLVVVGLLGANAYHFEYAAVDGQPTTASEVPAGETVERSFDIQTASPGPSTVFVDAEGMTVEERTVNGSSVSLNATIKAPADPGQFRTTVRIHAYPSTLPEGVLRSLHAVHPFLAALSSVLVVFGPLAVLYLALFDRQTPIRPPRARGVRKLLRGDG